MEGGRNKPRGGGEEGRHGRRGGGGDKEKRGEGGAIGLTHEEREAIERTHEARGEGMVKGREGGNKRGKLRPKVWKEGNVSVDAQGYAP